VASGEAPGRRLPTGRCRHCSRSVFNGGTACKARRCPGYAPLWAGDQRQKLFDNLLCFAREAGGSGRVALATLTGPGQDVLPWDRRRCASLGKHTCSGNLGCRVDERRGDAWNRSAPDRWRRVHRRAYQETKRQHPELWVLARVWEMQHRGVLHVHPVLAIGTSAQLRAAVAYIDALARLAPQYGFGFADRKVKRISAKAAAAYLSSYFVTGKRDKATLQQSVLTHWMPRSIVHVSVRLTQVTGVTMRELRFRRFVWARYGWLIRAGAPELARRLAERERVIGGPLEGDEVDRATFAFFARADDP
jgi:hypothetical protein